MTDRPTPPQSAPPRNLLVSCLALLGGLAVMCMAGEAVGREYRRSVPIPAYRDLGRPPEPIARLLAADFDTVYVETTSLRRYACTWESPYDVRCWVPVSAVPPIHDSHCSRPQAPPAPPPAGAVVAVAQHQHCGSFAGITDYSAFTYFLMADGRVVQTGDDEFGGTPPGLWWRWLLAVCAGWLVSGLGYRAALRGLRRWSRPGAIRR